VNNPLLNRYGKYLGVDVFTSGFDTFTEAFEARRKCIREYGFAIPSEEACKRIASLGGEIIELGAGLGYWAKCIEECGGKVVAYDKAVPGEQSENKYPFRTSPLHFPVVDGDEFVLEKSDANVLLLIWPCYNSPFANNCLRLFRGEHVAYVGEGAMGCTGDDEFHQNLGRNWEFVDCLDIPQWSGIHDDLYIYKRKTTT